jgi:hypothetical protein
MSNFVLVIVAETPRPDGAARVPTHSLTTITSLRTSRSCSGRQGT